MGDTTEISWADRTFNPWTGCEAISPGCDHCYAQRLVERWGGNFAVRRRTSEANWKKPVAWNREAEKSGKTSRVFCASLADVFDNRVPDAWRVDLWELIDRTPHLTWLLLTKRIGNVSGMLPAIWSMAPPKNLWLGITVVNQEEAERDIPKLLQAPAVLRWLSCEPLLGPITDLPLYLSCDYPGMMSKRVRGIDWVIAGGESGHGARPTDPAWLRGLRDACARGRTPFHVKQITERGRKLPMGEWPSDLRVQEFPTIGGGA